MKHLSAGPGTCSCACFTCGTHRYSNVLKKVVHVLHSFMIRSQWKHLHFCQISTQTCMQKIQPYFTCDHWEYDILKCGKRGIEKCKKEAKIVISDMMQYSLVDRVTGTNVSKDTAASIFFYPEDGDIMLLQNISIQLKDYTMLSPLIL